MGAKETEVDSASLESQERGRRSDQNIKTEEQKVDASRAAKDQEHASVISILFNRGFLTLFVAFCCMSIGYSFVATGLMVHATEDFGMDQVVVGTIISTLSFITMVTRPFAAIFSDRFNRKKIFIFDLCLMAIATAGFAFANNYVALYACQIIKGVAFALCMCVSGVMVADIVGRKEFGVATGVFMINTVVGTSIASAVVVAMGDTVGYTVTFLVAAAVVACGIVIAATLPYEHKKSQTKKTLKEHIKSIRLRDFFAVECVPIAIIAMIIQILVIGTGITYLLMFGRVDLNIANVGIAGTISSVITYFSRPWFGRMMDKHGARVCVIPTFVGFIITSVLYATSTDMVGLIIGSVIFGAICGGYSVMTRTMSLRRSEVGHEAAGTQTNGIGSDIGMIIGGTLVPAIAVAFGGFYRPVYWAMAILAVIGLIYVLIYTAIYMKRHPDNEMNW